MTEIEFPVFDVNDTPEEIIEKLLGLLPLAIITGGFDVSMYEN